MVVGSLAFGTRRSPVPSKGVLYLLDSFSDTRGFATEDTPLTQMLREVGTFHITAALSSENHVKLFVRGLGVGETGGGTLFTFVYGTELVDPLG